MCVCVCVCVCVGEASASTMWDNKAWMYYSDNTTDEPPYLNQDFIHALHPDTRLIVIFRDPVERWDTRTHTHTCTDACTHTHDTMWRMTSVVLWAAVSPRWDRSALLGRLFYQNQVLTKFQKGWMALASGCVDFEVLLQTEASLSHWVV